MHDRWNAFADLDPQARGSDGPLAGLSIGIKSNIAVKGLPWTAGMGTRRGFIADHDAAVVAQLRAAGAMIPGTLNMHEAALGATTDNAFYGRTHNPHRHGYTPGGSSGGSGAAVAAGLVDAALGTDTLGSIRIPAAYCGVYGLKPTLGAVEDDGLVHLGSAFDVIGPLARDLEILERVWAVIGKARSSPALTRVLALVDLADVDVQPEVRSAYQRIAAQLGPTATVAFEDSTEAIRLAALGPCVEELKALLGEERCGPGVSDNLESFIAAIEGLPPQPHVIERTGRTLIEALGSDGVLVMPTAPQVAFAHGTRAPWNQADFTCLASVAGLPALSIPAGLSTDGLPIGVQLVGPAGSELQLIAIARTLG